MGDCPESHFGDFWDSLIFYRRANGGVFANVIRNIAKLSHFCE
ncbi:hypothetical protein BAOM_1367 [Peribacillus asahii]|uniref:Uncharacterized protein n=1 Tax=Peribacillus asahii TaxID=228899 RepID=A0A3T0KNP7_9BACI|nr:hypothetical protein BAOM_1367 [Peribacillus asahii]